jgi:hypothetical protein
MFRTGGQGLRQILDYQIEHVIIILPYTNILMNFFCCRLQIFEELLCLIIMYNKLLLIG